METTQHSKEQTTLVEYIPVLAISKIIETLNTLTRKATSVISQNN